MNRLLRALKTVWIGVGIVFGAAVGLAIIGVAGAIGILIAEAVLRLMRIL